jgi:UDP-N-acetylmuramyl pentapeptide phosphotransferase/UDP-N-acetylglucosamine-1-phosphate transferase
VGYSSIGVLFFFALEFYLTESPILMMYLTLYGYGVLGFLDVTLKIS